MALIFARRVSDVSHYQNKYKIIISKDKRISLHVLSLYKFIGCICQIHLLVTMQNYLKMHNN